MLVRLLRNEISILLSVILLTVLRISLIISLIVSLLSILWEALIVALVAILWKLAIAAAELLSRLKVHRGWIERTSIGAEVVILRLLLRVLVVFPRLEVRHIAGCSARKTV